MILRQSILSIDKILKEITVSGCENSKKRYATVFGTEQVTNFVTAAWSLFYKKNYWESPHQESACIAPLQAVA